MALAVTLFAAANVRSFVLHLQSTFHACAYMTTLSVITVALSIHTYYTSNVVALILVHTDTRGLVFRGLDRVVIVTRTVARRKTRVRITVFGTVARRSETT